MADRIGNYMKQAGTNFIRNSVPVKLEKSEDGKITVTYTEQNADGISIEKQDQFDTVLFAIGRYAVTEGINPQNAGVIVEKNGKIKANEFE